MNGFTDNTYENAKALLVQFWKTFVLFLDILVHNVSSASSMDKFVKNNNNCGYVFVDIEGR